MAGTITSKTEQIDELLTTTWYSINGEIDDQVYMKIPFWMKMIEEGRIVDSMPDGEHWETTVRYAKRDDNIQYFGEDATFGRARPETKTRLLWYPRNIGTSMVREFTEENKNRGRAKIIDYVNNLVDETKLALQDKLALDILVQNADPLAIDALETIISTTPTTGTVGTKSRSTDTYLQNQVTDFTGLTTAASLIDEMETIYNKCSEHRFWGSPDMILTTRVVWQDLKRILRAMGQFDVSSKPGRADFGVEAILFNRAEVFYDVNVPAGRMYFLNTKALEFKRDPDVWNQMTAWKTDADEINRVAQILSIGQLTARHWLSQGVIHSITATSS